MPAAQAKATSADVLRERSREFLSAFLLFLTNNADISGIRATPIEVIKISGRLKIVSARFEYEPQRKFISSMSDIYIFNQLTTLKESIALIRFADIDESITGRAIEKNAFARGPVGVSPLFSSCSFVKR